MYNVKFIATIQDYPFDKYQGDKTSSDWYYDVKSIWREGIANVELPFLPFTKLHIGQSQFLTVCQVHWLGDNSFRADLEMVECVNIFYKTRYYDDLDALEQKIRSMTPYLNWVFTDIKDEE